MQWSSIRLHWSSRVGAARADRTVVLAAVRKDGQVAALCVG